MEDLDSWEKKGKCSIILSRLNSNEISPFFGLYWILFIWQALNQILATKQKQGANCLHQSVGRAQLTSLTDRDARKKEPPARGGKIGGETL